MASVQQTPNGAQHANGHRAPGQPAGTLRFQVNVPEQVALQFRTGREVEGQYGPQVMFSLSDGRRMYLDPPVAASVEQLGVRPREFFSICKRKGIGTGHSVRWEVTRLDPPAGNGAAAQAQAHAAPPERAYGSNLERQLAKSIEQVERAKANGHGAANGAAPSGLAQVVSIEAATISSMLRVSVDALVSTQSYAKKQHGVELAFNEEDVRAIATTLFITATREGGWR
jgi:hypothetical protein